MLWLPQTEIEAQLRARLSALGGEIEWNNPVLGMLQDDDRVSVELGTGEHARAAWAIGYDGANGQFVAMPLPHPDGDLWRLMAPVSAEQDGELGEAGIVALLRRFAAERAGIADLDVDSAEWASVFRFHRRLADSFRSGRVLLAGDARTSIHHWAARN